MATTGEPPPHQISGDLEPKYTGVRKRKWGKWVSEIRLPNSRERIWLGSYDSPEKAARAFDAAMFCLRGRNAKFNFPNNPPEILDGESLSPHSIQIVAAQYANESTPTPTTAETDGNAYQQSHAPPDVAAPPESGMDWAFLSMLDGNNEMGREFGYFAGLENTGYGYDPPSIFNDDQNWDESAYNQSFLWNFN